MESTSPPTGEETSQNLVVIGASAGGVETLVRVVGGLPADLPATVCIVLHIAPGSPSALPSILRRAGRLPCRSAVDGETLRNAEILVAPPDRHLTVDDGHVRLTVDARENGHRPSVDVLFRTAAAARNDRVIGVVLSGTRDDGTAGLAVIKERGGTAIVQDPEEALYPGMPASAVAHVSIDAVVPSDQVAETIVRALRGELPPSEGAAPALAQPAALGHPGPGDNPGHGPRLASVQGGAEPGGSGGPAGSHEKEGTVTSVCPECGGVLSEHREAGFLQWRCKVGHRYSPESLADAQAEGVEGALWAAVRALEDRQALLERMADQLAGRSQPRSAASFRRRAREAAEQAEVVRGALRSAAATTLKRVDDSDSVEAERRGMA